MSLKCVVDALALVDGVQTLRTCDRLHGQIRTHRHTLMNMSSRRKRIGSLLLSDLISACRVQACRTILAGLLHRWQLQLLVVEVVGFLTSVSLTVVT